MIEFLTREDVKVTKEQVQDIVRLLEEEEELEEEEKKEKEAMKKEQNGTNSQEKHK